LSAKFFSLKVEISQHPALNQSVETEGTINMAQVAQALTFNAATGISSGIPGVTDQGAGCNLCGLGQCASLQLMGGKRVPSANVQMLLPGRHPAHSYCH